MLACTCFHAINSQDKDSRQKDAVSVNNQILGRYLISRNVEYTSLLEDKGKDLGFVCIFRPQRPRCSLCRRFMFV